MGLDMYLRASKYVGDWEHSKDEERAVYKAVTEAVGLTGYRCDGSPSIIVNLTVAYWRKANQIHKWFVDNVQEGEDDCGSYPVSKEKLAELLDLCKHAKETKESGALPPTSGFFFGSTDIDEYYWQDIDETIKQLSTILANETLKTWSFEYHSSW